jgi:putative ABC transport system ATP-binding protein
MAKTLIKLEGIGKTYGKGSASTVVLRSVRLSIKPGEFVAITGASGSGKTTLMNIIGLLDRPTTGSYHLNDVHVNRLKEKDLAKLRRQEIGFVFQNFNLLGRLTARANVELPMMYNRFRRKQRRIRSGKLLKIVRLEKRMKFHPTQLSGGEMQRVAIARSLANQPSLLLADEPTGNLDSKNGAMVMRILQRLNSQGTTVILVTHDISLARKAGRIIHIKDGRILSSRNTPRNTSTRKSPTRKTKRTPAKRKAK